MKRLLLESSFQIEKPIIKKQVVFLKNVQKVLKTDGNLQGQLKNKFLKLTKVDFHQGKKIFKGLLSTSTN